MPILRYERPRRSHPLRRLAKPLAGAAVLLVVATAALRLWSMRGPRVLVEPPRVERGSSGTVTITATGTLVGELYRVYPRVSGRLADLLVGPGASVGSGNVIGHLENSAHGRAAAAAESALGLAREALSAAQLQPDGPARRTALRAATDRLERANAHALVARRRLEDTYIKAPREGRAIRRLASLGDLVAPEGAPGARAVAEIMEAGTLRAVADVPARQAAPIRAGDAASIRLDSVPRQHYQGSVASVTSGSGGLARVTVRINVMDNRTRPGFRGRLEITSRSAAVAQRPHITVPEAALRRDAGQTVVWVLSGNRLERRVVDAAPVRDGRSEIRTGLSGGELVVVAGPVALEPGMLVRAANAPARDVP